jgi:dipeptidyl aminopeptidase/acylaminoacyl peptidase
MDSLLELQDAIARLRTTAGIHRPAVATLDAWIRKEVDKAYPPKQGEAELKWFNYGDGLKAHLAIPKGAGALPLLVLMHGFRGQAADFQDATLKRFATSYGKGVFVAAVSMRGRDGSKGTPDSGGKEIDDIAEAVEALLKEYPKQLSPDNVHIVGYSGGGGNAMSAAALYPKMFQTATSFFGISDYAQWYRQANADQRKYLLAWTGSEAAMEARDVCAKLAQYPGVLRLYHDRGDNNVPVGHSERALACRPESLANFSEEGDAVRWIHENPNGDPPVRQAEREFLLRVALWSELKK